jgi:head-tail adaptor
VSASIFTIRSELAHINLGALLWHWLGPHYYVMRLAITLFNLSIAFCGCIVAERTLAHRTNLALLFCVTLAFQVSAPGVCAGEWSYDNLTALGISQFYNRHIMSALAVLFLQTFGGGPISSMREHASEVAVAACLLTLMFLTKISGFMLGVMILFAGCLLQGRTTHRLLSLCATVLTFAVIIAIEFKATGLELLPIIQDYELAAHARLSYSLNQIVTAMVAWPLVGSVALLVLFAVSQRVGELRLEFRCIVLIIGTYTACQYALNMTNNADPSMWLAPAAMASLAVCVGAKPAAQQGGGSESWWQRIAPSLLAARQVIPFLMFVLVLVPQIMSSVNGANVGTLISLGIDTPYVVYVVTAGKGISFRSHPEPSGYERSLPDAVSAISSLKLGDEAIANLDLANPFPVLFLAPPPKGIQVFWSFGINVPADAPLEWKDVIGDACVVTIPVQPWVEFSTNRLVDIIRPTLATDFNLVFQDALWSIYRRTRNCATASLHRPGAQDIASPEVTEADAQLLEIVAFSPNAVQVGQPFNVQPDGASAIWVRASRNIPGDSRIRLGDSILNTSIHAAFATAGVPISIIQQAGNLPVSLVGPDGKPRSNIASLEVTVADVQLLEIVALGPNPVQVGQPFNLQPDGASAIWVRGSRNIPSDSRIRLGDSILNTTIQGALATAGVPISIIQQAGNLPVSLVGLDGKPRSDIASLEVAVADAQLLEIVALGPNPVQVGQPFNVQPNGASAIWVRASRNIPSDSQIRLGDSILNTTIQGALATAGVPISIIQQAGNLPVSLVGLDGKARSNIASLEVKQQ